MTAGGPALQRCRVCGAADVPAGAPRCQHCGAAVGTLEPCPCCGAEAGASPHPELRYACDVCGGPRVPRLDRSIQYGGQEAAHLRRADAARKGRAGWRAAAVAGGLLLPFSILAFLVLLLVFGANAALVAAGLVCVAPVAAFLAFALSRASARGREIAPALDAAWLSAATDVARQTRGITAAALAQKLGLAEPQAEELLALVDANSAAGPRMRIYAPGTGAAPGPGGEPAGATDVLASEEEADLAARIEAKARAGLGREET
jgi:hypothetical protein